MTVKDKFENVWNKIKMPLKAAATVACFGMLPSSCKDRVQDKEPIKDMLYYYENNLPSEVSDMYGNHLIGKLVEIKVYQDAMMDDENSGDVVQMRWGVPQSDYQRDFDIEKTHAEYVYLDEKGNARGWIEVFDNEYGVSICKDQPCFMVDKNGCLRLIGNDEHYDCNLQRYKNEQKKKEMYERQRIENNKKKYYERRKNWDEKQADIVASQGFIYTDAVLMVSRAYSEEQSDSLMQGDTLSTRPDSDILQVSIDSLKKTRDQYDR